MPLAEAVASLPRTCAHWEGRVVRLQLDWQDYTRLTLAHRRHSLYPHDQVRPRSARLQQLDPCVALMYPARAWPARRPRAR
jgi:hypothetical protein